MDVISKIGGTSNSLMFLFIGLPSTIFVARMFVSTMVAYLHKKEEKSKNKEIDIEEVKKKFLKRLSH